MNVTQRGSSLLEVMAAVAIFAIGSLATLSLFMGTTREVERDRYLASRARLLSNIIRLAGQPASLRASAYPTSEVEPANTYFRFCVFGDPAFVTPCIHLNGDGQYRPFRLYLPFVVNKFDGAGGVGFQVSGFITGTVNFPMRYGLMGEPCDTSQNLCDPDEYPFEVTSEFLPMCPPKFYNVTHYGTPEEIRNLSYPTSFEPDPACWSARFAKVRITIKPSNGVKKHSQFAPQARIVSVDMALARHARQ